MFENAAINGEKEVWLHTWTNVSIRSHSVDGRLTCGNNLGFQVFLISVWGALERKSLLENRQDKQQFPILSDYKIMGKSKGLDPIRWIIAYIFLSDHLEASIHSFIFDTETIWK